MISHVETVPFGRPATEALSRAVARAKRAGAAGGGRGPLSPVTVAVGSNFAGLSLRRLLGSGELGVAGLANVGFLTPFQLAELLAPPRPGRRPLTNPVLGAAVRRTLADDPGPFGEVATHPATEAAVAGLYAELSHLDGAALARVASTGHMASTAVELHRRVSRRLEGFDGEPELVSAIIEDLEPTELEARLGHLVWHLPEPATPSLERLMLHLAGAVDTSVLVGLTGDRDADEPVSALMGRAGVTPPEPAVEVSAPVSEHLVSVVDHDDEARAAVRRVVELAEAGVRLDRMAIFYPRADPYVRALEHHLAEAGVPANGPSRERLADSAAGRTLLGALELPAHNWRRDRVMALVASAPLRSGERGVYPTSWERLSRTAGVVGGLGDWARKLEGHHAALGARLVADPGIDPGRAERLEREQTDARELAEFVRTLAKAVGAITDARGWGEKSRASVMLLEQLLGPEHRRQGWPDDEVDAAGRVLDALARLALLDEIEPDPPQDVFVRALGDELDVGRRRSGRFGDGVAYGPLSSAPGQDLDAVVILGLAEGVLPGATSPDSLLSDAAREAAGPGLLVGRADHLHRQHRALLAAIAGAPPSARSLLHPRGDLRNGSANLPSRWFLDSVSAAVGEQVYSSDLHDLGSSVVQVVASHADGVLRSSVPASVAEHDLRSIRALRRAGADPLEHPAFDRALARRAGALRSRWSDVFTEWDGNLAGVPVPSPTRDGALLSPTGLESWAECGFRYYLSHVLHLRDRDDPERIRAIDARDRGSLVHEILERFLAEAIDTGPPDPGQPWSPAQRARLGELAVEVFDRYEAMGRTGRPLGWRLERQRLLGVLDRFLDADQAHRAAWRSRPDRVELPFGVDGADPVVFELPDGRSLHFRGVADRVDRAEDGRWIVIDYKTGKGTKYRDLEDDPFLGGTTLQLGLYSEAAHQLLGGDAAAAYYWLVDDPGSATPGYDWDDRRRERFGDLVSAMVEGIDAGVFAASPGEFDNRWNAHENCRYCDFDRICPTDRGEMAEAKVAAPELAVRRRLHPADDGDGQDRGAVGDDGGRGTVETGQP